MQIVSAIIQLLGGLAMFLYGIEVMGDGLKNSSGEALKRVLEKVTGNVILGVLTGTLVTAVIQSSSATLVLTIALIGAGVLNLKQAVSIVLGANIGTTITAQIVRLMDIEAGDNFFLVLCKPDTLAPLALIVGIVLIMFIKRKGAKTMANIFVGFGIMFIGLMNMSASVEPLSQTEAFRNALLQLNNPFVGILTGMVITAIIQSSSATVSMLQAIAVSGTGLLTFRMAYPVIMGINIGTCATAIVCAVSSGRDAKRTAVVHVTFNVVGTVLFMIAMSILEGTGLLGSKFWTQAVDSGIIANFQTIFNLVTAVALLPFTGLLVKLSTWIIKDEKPQPPRHPELHTLDEKLYISPAVALVEATKAVAAMGVLAKDNFHRCCEQLFAYDEAQHGEIDADEDCLDRFADSCDRFLIGLSKVAESDAEDRQIDMLLQSAPNFERVGDYGTNLVELAQRLRGENACFSDSARQELRLLQQAVGEILDITVSAFAENDNEKAKAVEPLEEIIDDMVILLRDRHTQRLKSGACGVGSGLVFMETLTYFERAADQCSSIAVMMLARADDHILLNHHDYLRQIHVGNDAGYAAAKEARREQYIKPLQEIQ